jgi:hypothetical protein
MLDVGLGTADHNVNIKPYVGVGEPGGIIC